MIYFACVKYFIDILFDLCWKLIEYFDLFLDFGCYGQGVDCINDIRWRL